MSFIYRSKQLIMVAGDVVCFTLGLWLALTLRNLHWPVWQEISNVFFSFLAVFFIWLVINYINGLYDLSNIKNSIYYKKIFEAGLISFFVGIGFFYLLPGRNIAPKTILFFNVIFGYCLSALWRFGYNEIIGERRLRVNVLFVGYTEAVKELITSIKANPGKGYRVAAIIDRSETAKSTDYPEIEIYREYPLIRPAVTTKKINLIVISQEVQNDADALRELYELLFWEVEIIHLSSFYETVTGRVTPAVFSEAWFLEHLKKNNHPVYQRIKTILDYGAGMVMSICLIPLFIPIALAVRINSRGPIFFKQKRVGKGGKIFTIYKFRSMYALSADGSAELKGFEFAQKNDVRITKVGKFLRHTRLDELPQFVNLLKGELSLIGPRPERPEIVEKLKEQMAYYPLRHTVKPGITGWAVIHQNYTSDLESSLRKLQYDLYYIKNRSVLLDLSIALKTVNVVVRMMGQ